MRPAFVPRCRGSRCTPVLAQAQFGGAIVSRLAGSAKVLRGDSSFHLPLLTPGDGPSPRLPFLASVECVRSGAVAGASHGAVADGLVGPRVSAPVHALPAAPVAALREAPVACASRCDRAGSCSCSDNNSQMLDVLYALGGTGVVTTADGHERRISSGDSLVAWHNTTRLRSVPGEDPPVLLKFHFPAAVLMLPPGTVVAPAPSHADLKVLVDECQGPHDGELSAAEADHLLRGVQTRAARAISHLYAAQPEEQQQRAGVAAASRSDSGSGSAPSAASAGPAVASRPAANNAVPVPPLLRRLFRSATGAWLPGLGKLRPQAAPPPPPPPPAPAAPACPASAVAAAVAASSGCVLLQRALEDFKAFRFPRQTNKLAFVFDPAELGLSLSFGVEVFEPGHHTPLHIHKTAHELFFVLAGEGVAFCNGQRFTVRAGDVVVFPPRAVHGIDNNTDDKLYCLQLMTPNEAFVEHVKSGEAVGRLDDEDICNLASRHC